MPDQARRLEPIDDDLSARRLNREREIRIVAEARRRRELAEQAQQAEQDSGGSDVMGFLNKGIAGVLGAPVDLANLPFRGIEALTGWDVSSERPFLGSESIRSGFEKVGIPTPERDPESVAEHAGQFVGEATASLLPSSAAARALSLTRQVPGAIARRPTTVGRIAEVIDEAQTQMPKRALAAEGMAVLGGGIAGGIAAEEFPEDSWAQPLAQTGGAVLGAAGPTMMAQGAKTLMRSLSRSPLPIPGLKLAGGAADFVKRTVFPYTQEGAGVAVSERFRGLAASPEEAASRLNNEYISLLSPATRTGDQRLMALEKKVLEGRPAMEEKFIGDLALANARLRSAMESDTGDITNVRKHIQGRVDRLNAALDARVQRAGAEAAQDLEMLAPGTSRVDAATMVRRRLDSAYKDAVEQERQVWAEVPRDIVRPTKGTVKKYQDLWDGLTKAQKDHMPEKAKRFLDPESKDFIGDAASIRELHGLYSEFGAIAQNARAGASIGQADRQMARIAEELRDSLMTDIGRGDGTEAGQLLDAALGYSRNLNQKFRQGTVGRILGTATEGGSRIAAEETLEAVIGSGRIRGAVGVEELRAADGDGDQTMGAMADYLKHRFADRAVNVQTGKIDSAAAQKFLNENRELMDMFPAVRDQIKAARTSGDLERRVRNSSDAMRKRLQSPTVSYAAKLLDAPIDKEMQRVFSASNPVEMARQMKRMVRNDPTPEGFARQGLRDGAIEEFFRRASSGLPDEYVGRRYSGRAMKEMLDDRRIGGAMKEILNGDELKRLRQVADEFSLIERRLGNLRDVGDPMDGMRNRLAENLASFLFLKGGKPMREGLGGGSLKMSQIQSGWGRDIARILTNERAEKLLVSGIADDELMKSLLLGETSNPREKVRAIMKINSWAGGVGRELMEDMGLLEPWEEVEEDESGNRVTRKGMTFEKEEDRSAAMRARAEEYVKELGIGTEATGRLKGSLYDNR